MKIKVSPFAERDIEFAIEYYNQHREKLGLDFVKEINITLNRISKNYEQFPNFFKEIRKANTHRFPYGIFFVAEQSTIYVLGIFHLRRNPKTIKRRLIDNG